MSNYSIAVAWSGKDALADTNPSKVISGSDFNTEFTAIQTAVNSKAELNGSTSEAFNTDALTVDGNQTVSGTLGVTGATTLGTATATTMPGDDDSTNIATTAFVNGEIYDNKNTANYPVVMDSTDKLPALDGSQLTGITKSTNTVFTSSGTFDVPIGITKIYVTASGGGGGGGRGSSNKSGGGGAGGCIKAPVTVTAEQTLTITIGSGGAAGANGGQNNGSAGGNTTITGTGVSVTLSGGGAGQGGGTTGGSGGGTSGVSNALVSGSGTAGSGNSGEGSVSGGSSELNSAVGASWGNGGSGYAHTNYSVGGASAGTAGYCLIEI